MSRVARLPDSAREVLIAVNPTAGARSGRDKVEQVRQGLLAAGYSVAVLEDRDEVARRSAETLEAGALRALVCAGGDGTVAFAANVSPPGTPLSILPLGTENLLAKYLGRRADAESIVADVRSGWIARLDAGLANGRLFTLMVGIGFDAEVVRRLHARRRGHIRHWSYAKPIWESVRSYTYPELRVTWESAPQGAQEATMEQPVGARWVFVANLPRYAKGLGIVPEAVATDGLLDVSTFRRGGLWTGLRYLWSVVRGRLRRCADCRMWRTRRVRIESDEPVPYQLDGDAGGTLPLEIEILPERLTLNVSRDWLDRSELAAAAAALCPEST